MEEDLEKTTKTAMLPKMKKKPLRLTFQDGVLLKLKTLAANFELLLACCHVDAAAE